MQQGRKPIDVNAITATLIASHPGMHLGKNGTAVPRPFLLLLIVVLCAPGLLTIFPLPAVMIQPEILESWLSFSRIVAISAAGLVLWLTSALWRSRSNPHDNGVSIPLYLFLVTFLTGSAYMLTNATLLRLVPLLSSYAFETEQSVNTKVRVRYVEPCRRRCLGYRLTGTAGEGYTVLIDDYPGFFAPITVYVKPVDVPVARYSLYGDQTLVTMRGKGNSLAIRVLSVKKTDVPNV